MSYKHLSLEQRYYIMTAMRNGKTIQKIAEQINRSPSTIYREIKRNSGQKGYRYQQADRFHTERKMNAPKNVKVTLEIKSIIEKYIEQDWSPEQIAGRLRREGVLEIHHETIYRYILKDKRMGGTLYKHLRHQNKTYRKRYGSTRSRSGIPNRVDIDKRPEVANTRSRIGDWEGDTIIGHNHKGAITTLDERVTKIRLAFPAKRKMTNIVSHGIIKMLEPLKEIVKTITFDNGKEFCSHESIAEALDCDIYFAKPYHSWERGQNENSNGLLRQYFPKKKELANVSVDEVKTAVEKLNTRPRKCLEYKTPFEAFKEMTGIDRNQIMSYCT